VSTWRLCVMPSQTEAKCEFYELCHTLFDVTCENCPLEPEDSDTLQLMDELNVEWADRWKEKAK
jgi:hypothetical protein